MNLYDLRKRIHKIPERGFSEFKTQELILEILSNYPELTIKTFDFTGIIASYKGSDSDEYILFRSDMDALPIREETDCDFRSEHVGFMHACGHDIHMTILLGLIDRLMADKPKANYLFVFQPAEEGLGGAEKLLGSGYLDQFCIKEAYALHVSGDYPVGTVATNDKILFGIPQEFKVNFHGRSSHIAFPNRGKDALAAGVQFYQTMQTLMNLEFPATEPVIFYIGTCHAGNVMNAVPDNCEFEGTTRSLTKDNHDKINMLIERTADSIARAYGLESEVEFLNTYDPVVNSPELYRKLEELLPKNVNLRYVEPLMTGEDFGFFTTKYKGLLFWLGAGEKSGDLHSEKFLPNEKCIDVGINVLHALAVKNID